ncbi:MAG: ribonuclease III [Eubacterium sp.]|nr:ribonuclease III [Eubacterium sp.]
MDKITKREIRELNPLTLAFLGDGVYEVLVREKIAAAGSMSAAKLHKSAVNLVRASSQSSAVDIISPLLTDEEMNIYKRGRNANNNTVPRSSNPRDYRRATGLEALFGYLHMIGEEERLRELFEVIYSDKKNLSGSSKL